jgi:hypothetical protein
MITFQEFLQNKTAGAFGKPKSHVPDLKIHQDLRKGVESDASITNRLGKSSITRMRQKEKTSLLPPMPSIGATPGRQFTVDRNFGRKPLQFFQKEPKIKNVPVPKSLQ